MTQFQNLEIDWEIHQLIEKERKGFDEPRYVALRRLLRLPPPTIPLATSAPSFGGGKPWTDSGVTVPHGSLGKMEYLRGSQVYEGQFLNGKLVVNVEAFDTLFAAADALAVTKDGKKPSLNGWLYWKAQFPGESHWRSLDEMRRRSASPGQR